MSADNWGLLGLLIFIFGVGVWVGSIEGKARK